MNESLDAHEPTTVGVFPHPLACMAVEDDAGDLGRPTAPCKEWRPIEERLARGLWNDGPLQTPRV